LEEPTGGSEVKCSRLIAAIHKKSIREYRFCISGDIARRREIKCRIACFGVLNTIPTDLRCRGRIVIPTSVGIACIDKLKQFGVSAV
jgi:hypothetical protein